MDILYLSPCPPNPPDKGERIRAFHTIGYFGARCRVHLACFVRSGDEAEKARAMSDQCASIYVEQVSKYSALASAALRFAMGGCLTTSYYSSSRLKRYAEDLAQRVPLAATVVYSSAMFPMAPPGVPILLDMSDVDSEKWLQYAEMRRPSFIFAAEGRRLRELEIRFVRAAKSTVVMTEQEAALLAGIVPGAPIKYLENGVDYSRFDPARCAALPALEGRRFLVFVGMMNYYPNVDAVDWFARQVFPELRRRDPGLEFLIVGREPAKAVLDLQSIPGVQHIVPAGGVEAYLAASAGVVAPLRLARGIQNKVLEGLAMGKRVFSSPAICGTLGEHLPAGVVRCETEADYIQAISGAKIEAGAFDPQIRLAAMERFSWPKALEGLFAEVLAVRRTLG